MVSSKEKKAKTIKLKISFKMLNVMFYILILHTQNQYGTLYHLLETLILSRPSKMLSRLFEGLLRSTHVIFEICQL